MSVPRVLLIAFGDDSVGSRGLSSRLLGKLRMRPLAESWWLTVVEDTQLRIEHALQLQANELALFIDTSPGLSKPLEFSRLEWTSDHKILPMDDTLEPSDLLHTLSTIGRMGKLPGSFRLTLAGGSDGQPDSPAVTSDAHVDAAVDFLEDLLGNAQESYWLKKTG